MNRVHSLYMKIITKKSITMYDFVFLFESQNYTNFIFIFKYGKRNMKTSRAKPSQASYGFVNNLFTNTNELE